LRSFSRSGAHTRLAGQRQDPVADAPFRSIHRNSAASIGWERYRRVVRTIRSSVRALRRQPGFATLVVLTSALGIGTATAVYSLIYAILLRPYPYANPDRLVRVQSRHIRQGDVLQGCSLLDIEDLRRRATTIEDVGAYTAFANRIIDDGGGEVAVIGQLHPAALSILGVRPWLGRLFAPDDDRPGGDVHKAILSYDLWQARFHSDPAVVGRPLRTDRVTYTIVGVMPPRFAFPTQTAFWTPMESWYALATDRPKRRDARFYATIARLKPGVTLAQAQSDLNRVAEALEREYPQDNEGVRIKLTPLRDFETGDVRPYLHLVGAGVCLVVLICCANVAGLLLVRTAGQRRQLAIQSALGASRARLIRMLLAESILLGSVGGVAGVALAYAAVRAVVALIPVTLPFWMTIRIDRSVLAFSILLTLAVALVFGAGPAVQASRTELNDAVREGSRGSGRRSRLRHVLVAGEMALSLCLLISAGLLVQTFLRLQHVDPGFRRTGLMTARVVKYQAGGVRQSAAALSAVHERILAVLRRIPGVEAAAATNGLPYVGTQTERGHTTVTVKGRRETRILVPLAGADVTADYFHVMQIPLRRGRLFDASDTNTSPFVAIVNERGAKLLWPDRDAVGQEVLWGSASAVNPYCRIVGVVGNVRQQAAESDNRIELYYPVTQWPIGNSYYVVSTTVDPDAIAASVRRAIESTEPTASVAEMKTMERRIEESLWQRRLWGVMFTAFAVLALALAAVGLYGVISHGVAQRTREFGIRMALGAEPSGVSRIVLREAMTVVAIGMVLGVAVALAAGRAIAHLLHGVPAHDPVTFLTVAIVLSVTAAAAAWVPARRAARVDPIVAIRAE
jgi:putative ABC transport system permease protein